MNHLKKKKPVGLHYRQNGLRWRVTPHQGPRPGARSLRGRHDQRWAPRGAPLCAEAADSHARYLAARRRLPRVHVRRGGLISDHLGYAALAGSGTVVDFILTRKC